MATDSKEIVRQIQASYGSLELGTAAARQELIGLSRKLISMLELPAESIQYMAYAEPAKFAHCRIAVEIGLFECLSKNGDKGTDLQTLASVTQADPTILAQIMKHLAAMDVVRELGPTVYAPTPLSEALNESIFREGIKYLYDVSAPSHRTMPSYFACNGFRKTREGADGPFQYAHRTPLSFYAWLDASAGLYRSKFNGYMSAPRAGRIHWTDHSSFVTEAIVKVFDPTISPVSVIDVGGGIGHDLIGLRKNFPCVPGKLILQDRREVIDALPEDPNRGFEPMIHNFFDPQPVYHARVYTLHSIMHDWKREQRVKIMANIAKALKPGYSKLLIIDTVVPETGASWLVTSFEWQSMALAGVAACTQSEWESMAAEAGLRIVKFHLLAHKVEQLIETEAL